MRWDCVKIFLFAFVLFAFSCKERPHDEVFVDEFPPIYPDYIGVTVPPNIAPLNFMLRGDYKNMHVETSGEISDRRGDSVRVTVKAQDTDGRWLQWRDFYIHVAEEDIDEVLTYRLIEPDYEVFSHLQIQERNITNFETRNLADYNSVGNRCMNCHTFGQNRPDLSFMYIRGENGGMILNRNGELRKLNLKTPEMEAGSVYAQFSPSGRYLVFSTNTIIPAFHAKPENRLEVYDKNSDVYIVDLETNTISTSPLLCDSTKMETFPCFTPDGKSIIYCKADFSRKPEEMIYSLYQIKFNEKTGWLGRTEECIFEARVGEKTSACHPRVSPDGRFLLFTVADYGTFPIWHRETDLRMMNLETGEIDSLDVVNSDLSDTYHSWSSNSRWFVFASKRDDGLYGRPYFSYVDKNGKVHKPFVLPQRDPRFYDNCLKSFNIPELGSQTVAFSTKEVQEVMKQHPESFIFSPGQSVNLSCP